MAERELPSFYYSNVFADHYESWFGTSSETADTVELLARLAGPGPVLELGIGIGRMALPRQARGFDCFTNATRRLAPDGLFVFDANLSRMRPLVSHSRYRYPPTCRTAIVSDDAHPGFTMRRC